MEVITKPKGGDIDKLARQVFDESINLLGGLRKLIEYRNLTWLPSLAEASFVLVLKNEAGLTNKEIAEKLGLTEQTVSNILRADSSMAEKIIKEPDVKVETHKAGAIAKLAFERLRKSDELRKSNEEEKTEEKEKS